MKTSNLVFSSNIYVLNGHTKISDPNFMMQVTDPSALKALVDGNRKLGGSITLHGVQRELYNNAIPCAYSRGDYTHGSIIEDGKLICVNKCENTDCPGFSKCSKDADYRAVVRDPDATFDFVEDDSDESDFKFDIDLPEPSISKNIFVKKLSSKVLHLPKKQIEIEEIVRNNRSNEWGVRPHIRHLADGTTTIVCGHTRRHWTPSSVSYVIKETKVPRLIVRKNFINRALIKKLAGRRANKVIEEAISTQTYQLKNIQPIDSAEVVIRSSLDTRILVNAGPGTGKTHTVIEKLKYIVKNEDDVDLEEILVLCFSRSAVKVIRDRLSRAMASGEISYQAKRLNVMTFDSFATFFLSQIEERVDLSIYSYDERINRFISKFQKDPEALNLQFLIVDEVQDLVGKRAEMVQTLLKNVKCGFMLLGDECQAIYDYQISNQNEMNATKLYEWMENYFGESLSEYELTREWRHQGNLEESFKPLRHSMLCKPYSTQKEQLVKLFKKFDIPGMGTEEIIFCCDDGKGKRAILSWANGDAYRQSQELYARDDIAVKHTILTGSRRLILRKELALILSKFQGNYITREVFIKAGEDNGIESDALNKIWNAILFTMNAEEGEVSLSGLRKILLSEKRVDDELIAQEDADVVISTIHKAKGREYDTVVVNKFGNIASPEDVKVYYVALTRAKKELIVKSKNNSGSRDIKTDVGRFIELSKGSDSKIKRVELGVDGDIDPIGFVSTKLSGFKPEQRQEYIKNNVKIGDPLRISKQNDMYLIIHNGYVIGRVRDSAFKPYKHYFPSGKYFTYYFDSYTDYVDVFVQNIISIVNQRLDESIPEPYNKSGFWLGIELCGYAKPMEE